MEIKNSTPKLVDHYRTRLESTVQEDKVRTRQTDAPVQQPVGDRISVSPEARLRTETYTAAMAAPDIRREKVNNIKDKIASGTYDVDPKNIAKKLLQSDVELAQAVRR